MEKLVIICDVCRHEVRESLVPLPNVWPNEIPKVCRDCLKTVRERLDARRPVKNLT